MSASQRCTLRPFEIERRRDRFVSVRPPELNSGSMQRSSRAIREFLTPRPTAGFTVLELVVVIAVIGVLALVALPRLSGLAGFDEVGYRDRVRSTIEYARKAAVAQRRNVQVSLAAGSVTVKIDSDIPEGALANTFDRNLVLPGSNSHTFSAPSGVSLSPAPTTLVFDAQGQPSASGSFTVTGSSAPIVVEAVTGYVH